MASSNADGGVEGGGGEISVGAGLVADERMASPRAASTLGTVPCTAAFARPSIHDAGAGGAVKSPGRQMGHSGTRVPMAAKDEAHQLLEL